MLSRRLPFALALMTWICTGCASSSGGSSGGTASGTAPTINNLTVTPTTVAVGKLETLSGQFDFDDPDGDLSQIGLTIRIGAQSTTVPKSALQNETRVERPFQDNLRVIRGNWLVRGLPTGRGDQRLALVAAERDRQKLSRRLQLPVGTRPLAEP